MTLAPTPALGLDGESCASCGAPLAADQRYCLACGTRRAQARLDFLEILRHRPTVAEAVPAASFAGDARSRLNLAVIAGIGSLLVAMGIGVLIGRSGTSSPPPQAAVPAQVIRIQGGGAAAAATPAAGKASPDKAAAKRRAGRHAPKAASKAPASVKALSGATGKDYVKKAAKLPKTVGTGGKPPPVDKSKPAAGGTGFQSIG